jgi:hypothetical protein
VAYDFVAAFGTATNFRALIQFLEVAQHLNGGTRGICQQHLEAGLRFLNPKPETLTLVKLPRYGSGDSTDYPRSLVGS